METLRLELQYFWVLRSHKPQSGKEQQVALSQLLRNIRCRLKFAKRCFMELAMENEWDFGN